MFTNVDQLPAVKHQAAIIKPIHKYTTKSFEEQKNLCMEKYTINKNFAKLFCKTLANATSVAAKLNLEILAEHQLAVIHPKTAADTHFHFTIVTDGDEHNYDFENIKLGDIELLRTLMEEIGKKMHDCLYYRTLDGVFAHHPGWQIQKNYILLPSRMESRV